MSPDPATAAGTAAGAAATAAEAANASVAEATKAAAATAAASAAPAAETASTAGAGDTAAAAAGAVKAVVATAAAIVTPTADAAVAATADNTATAGVTTTDSTTAATSADAAPTSAGTSDTDAADIATPPTRTIPPIEDSVDLASQPRDFLERYYQCRYLVDHRRPGGDYRLLFHSNGVIALMLAPSHPLVAGAATLTGIDFQVTEHTNRLENKVSGKGKRGAQLVSPEAPLFSVTCADGSRHVIPACARGKLVQINERLRAEPQLLVTDSGGKGFVALILPKLGSSRGQMAGTLSPEEYAARRPAAVQDAQPAGGR